MSTGSSSSSHQPKTWVPQKAPDLSPTPELAARLKAKRELLAGVSPDSAQQDQSSKQSKDGTKKSKSKHFVN